MAARPHHRGGAPKPRASPLQPQDHACGGGQSEGEAETIAATRPDEHGCSRCQRWCGFQLLSGPCGSIRTSPAVTSTSAAGRRAQLPHAAGDPTASGQWGPGRHTEGPLAGHLGGVGPAGPRRQPAASAPGSSAGVCAGGIGIRQHALQVGKGDRFRLTLGLIWHWQEWHDPQRCPEVGLCVSQTG